MYTIEDFIFSTSKRMSTSVTEMLMYRKSLIVV